MKGNAKTLERSSTLHANEGNEIVKGRINKTIKPLACLFGGLWPLEESKTRSNLRRWEIRLLKEKHRQYILLFKPEWI